MRADSVVKCQETPFCLEFLLRDQDRGTLFRSSMVGMRTSRRHWTEIVLSRQYPTKSRVLVYNVPRAFAQYGMLPEAKMPCRERRLHEYSNYPSPKRFSPRQGMLRPPATSLNEDSRQPQCPEDQERAIVEALKHFKMNR